MTDHYLADDADSRTVWNDGCIVPQIISLFRQRMAALFVPYLHQQYADNRVFSMVRAKKATYVSMLQSFLISGVSFHLVWGLEEMKRGRGANSRGLCHLRLLNQPTQLLASSHSMHCAILNDGPSPLLSTNALQCAIALFIMEQRGARWDII